MVVTMLLSALSGLVVMALMTTSTLGIPRPQWSHDQEGQELNEVWAPGPSPVPHKHFNPFSFKTLIKALARFNGPAKSHQETREANISSGVSPDKDLPDPSVSSEELLGGSTLDPLVDDLLDIPTLAPVEDDSLNIQPIVKPDKSNRFTHNFRFGYGALPGLP